jgi:hypothetical protein
MMNDGGKSDKSVVPKKDPNKARGGPHAAEGLEERDLAKGNPGGQSRFWTQNQIDLSHALDRIRKAAKPTATRHYLRQEPGAVIPHAGICAGGGPKGPFLPRPVHHEAFASPVNDENLPWPWFMLFPGGNKAVCL